MAGELPSSSRAKTFRPLRGGRGGDQVDDRRKLGERFAAPVDGDEGEQPMLDLVPLAGARREAFTDSSLLLQACLTFKEKTIL